MTDQTQRTRLFVGCVVALVATAFGFAVRGQLLGAWGEQFNLTQEQLGYIAGAGLYPFAISIILFSLIVDKLGYGVSMAIAFSLHVGSAILLLCAPLALAPEGASEQAVEQGQHAGYIILYVGTFLFALGNGTVEAVINPAVATLYPQRKTHYLSILHSGWPGGLVLGGLFGVLMLNTGETVGEALPGALWQWRWGLVLLPMLIYGVILLGQRFPVHERVAAGVSYYAMLQEFGWGSCYIVSFLLVAGINQIIVVFNLPTLEAYWWAIIAVVPTVAFGLYVRRFGRPIFFFLLLVMCLVATTELGGDSWMQKILGTVASPTWAGLLFAWMAFIMFVLRFYAGPVVQVLGPIGLLAASSAVACVGLLSLSAASAAWWSLFIAATVYGIGKTYFWPTMLGTVSEQSPKGGALGINAVAGAGMLFVGTLGNPGLGTVQNQEFVAEVRSEHPEVLEALTSEQTGVFVSYRGLDQGKKKAFLNRPPEKVPADFREALADRRQRLLEKHASVSELEKAAKGAGILADLDLPAEKEARKTALVTALARNGYVNRVFRNAGQQTLAWLAILPAIMLVAYLALIGYFRSKGGYRPETLVSETDGGDQASGE